MSKKKRKGGPAPATHPGEPAADPAPDDPSRWWLPAALLAGALAFAAQQLLLRELLVIYAENVLFAGIALGTWLLAGGAASAVFRAGAPWRERTVLALLVAQGVLVPLAVVGCRVIWHLRPHRASVAGMILLSLLVLGPCAFLSGALFAGLARGRADAARLLALECLGSLCGLAVLYHARLGCASPVALGCVLAAVPALWAAARRAAAPIVRAGTFAAVTLALALALAGAPALEHATLSLVWKPLEVALSLDTAWSRVSVLRKPSFLGGGLRFFVNRFPMWSIEDDAPHNEGLVHLPLLLHPAPKRVLIVGGGIGGNAREALAHPVTEVVLSELEPAVLAAGRWIFHRENRGALTDPRLMPLAYDGGRLLLEDQGQFDAVLLDLPDPYIPQLARFYSRDFLALARARLRPGGLIAIQLPPAKSPEDAIAKANRSLARTFRAVFPDAVSLFGRMDYLVGFHGPPPPLDGVLERFHERSLNTRWLTPETLADALPGSALHAARSLTLDAPDDRGWLITTDDRPVALAMDLYFWEHVGNAGAAAIPDILARWPPLLVAVLILALGACASTSLGHAARAPAASVLFAGGLVSQAAGTLVLHVVQTRSGTLLATAPVLAAAALTGHGLGALLPVTARHARALLALLAALLAALPWALAAAPPAAIVTAGAALLLLIGVAVGGLFAANLTGAGSHAGLLYGADLCGAALAAYVLLPVALPFAGVSLTALTLAVLVGLHLRVRT